MNYRIILAALTASALALSASPSFAESKAAAPQEAGSKTKANPKSAESAEVAKPKAPVKLELVNINGASAAELKKLPGIGDAEAKKIIAGRPYGSKAWLVSNGILSKEKYDALKGLVIAKQPYADGKKNAEVYLKLKKK